MKNNIHIPDSFSTWKPSEMREATEMYTSSRYLPEPPVYLNRSYLSMYIEWWLHNIGYYISKPFTYRERIRIFNIRCRDVDLDERKRCRDK